MPSVGTYDLNIEEIAALAPDLVVYGEVGGYLEQDQYDALSTAVRMRERWAGASMAPTSC